MLASVPRELPQVIGFVLLPQFSMIAFTSAVEALRQANRCTDKELYQWPVFSLDGLPVRASNGLEISVEGDLEAAGRLSAVAVCTGINVRGLPDKPLLPWLRRMDRLGADIGALCTGTYLLAKAGLLEGYSSTIHWENIAGFTEEFPELEVSNELFEVDRNRFTCAGGTAAMDLFLNVITTQHGHALAAKVADQVMHERIRDENDHQRMSLPARLGVRHPKLLSVIEEMERNLEEPLSRNELAREAGLSTRQLERLFRKYLKRSPARYYLELRLNRARLLLLQTNMSVIDVALACGFVSASHFSKCYRDYYGRTPRKERGLPAEVSSQERDAGEGVVADL